ncbi:MAG: hypothetical protein R2706_00935 [Acidimicrobiales bacterium]
MSQQIAINMFAAITRRLRRNRSWSATRPGDLDAGQPSGARLGSQGPDQGFAYKLVDGFDLSLGRVNRADAIAACVGIATKRAAAFGRGPMVEDLAVAFTVWGFLDVAPADDLVALREALFAEVRSSHHYRERREVIDMVSDETLALSLDAVGARYNSGWTNVIAAPLH